jgi:hypothetical protein
MTPEISQLLQAASPAHLSALLRRAGAAILLGSTDPAAAGADARLLGRSPSLGLALRRQHLHRQRGRMVPLLPRPFLVVRHRGTLLTLLAAGVLAHRPRTLIVVSLAMALCAMLVRLADR